MAKNKAKRKVSSTSGRKSAKKKRRSYEPPGFEMEQLFEFNNALEVKCLSGVVEKGCVIDSTS